jgi:hypothetical protein
VNAFDGIERSLARIQVNQNEARGFGSEGGEQGISRSHRFHVNTDVASRFNQPGLEKEIVNQGKHMRHTGSVQRPS